MIDVNIKGVLYGIAAVLPFMREQKSGHIINLSSVAGHSKYEFVKGALKQTVSVFLRRENHKKVIYCAVQGYWS